MVIVRSIFILTSIILAIGCSVYQSEGRKFLEKSAYEYAGIAVQAHLKSCQYSLNGGQWIDLQETELAKVSASDSDTETFRLRVEPKANPQHYNCEFTFSSAQEMYEKASAAVELTLLNLSLAESLGEFALRPLSHLK